MTWVGFTVRSLSSVRSEGHQLDEVAGGVVGDTERIIPRSPARGITAAVTEAARGVSRELGARRWPAAE